MIIMQAIVIEAQWARLLVLDLDTRQQFIINTPDARQFRPGELIRIWYNGSMTRSIPLQIYALRVAAGPWEPVPPAIPLPPIVFPPVIRPPAPRPPIGRPPHGGGPRPRPPRRRR